MFNLSSNADLSPILNGPHFASDRLSLEPIEVSAYFQRKAIWMRLLAAFLLILFTPVILLAMLLVRLTSPGPALFRQERLGREGRPFALFKIRTMYCDAEDLSGPILCLPGDSRVTPVGRVLRYLHLDELPQLVNVVRGEMCLVGPRPERPEIIAKHKLQERVPGFDARTKVLPGVTGLAQINLPADQAAESVVPKVKLDLEYIATASAPVDMRILLCTAMRMLGVRHGRAVRLFGVGRCVSWDPGARTEASFYSKLNEHFAPHPAEASQAILAYVSARRDSGDVHVLRGGGHPFEASDEQVNLDAE